jgi:hypothetical protein
MKPSKTILAIVAAVAMGLACNQAQAVPITGNINFAGSAVLMPNNLAGAFEVKTFSHVSVMDADGSFTGVTGPVTMAMPWVFVPSTPLIGLWSVGGFTFDLAATTSVLRPSGFLIITGTGTIFGPAGFDATPGSWRFSTQDNVANGQFSFSAATGGQGVPDGGMTVTLLGAGLVGLAAFRAKFAKAKA